MRKFLFSRLNLTVGAVVAAFVALPASAALADSGSSSCPSVLLTQPFLSFGDSNYYTLAPGQSPDSFDGTGWTLSGGANIVTTGLADGTQGSVLDLPYGASATSPVMCVDSGMPLASMLTQIVGGPKSNQTRFEVWDAATGTKIGGGTDISGDTSWGEQEGKVITGNSSGPVLVYFKVISALKQGDLQLYDLYIDPRMWG